MFATKYQNNIPYIVVRKEDAASDSRLTQEGNNGRKILANLIRPEKSEHIRHTEWQSLTGPGDKSQILETGCGGVEVGTFNEKTKQDCHKHVISTEICVVLEGTMNIRMKERDIVRLEAGDEIAVLPGTAHEVLHNSGDTFLTRVHSINCHGDDDKYVKNNSKWERKPR